MRASLRISFVTVPLATSLCTAQPMPVGGGSVDRPGMYDRPEGTSIADPKAFAERLARELKLDSAQREQVDRIMKEEQEELARLRQAMAVPAETRARMERLREQMAEAQGDADKLRELARAQQEIRREHMARVEPIRRRMAQRNQDLRAVLLNVMRAEQKADFERLYDEELSYGGRGRMAARDPRRLRIAVERLQDLTPDQRKRVEQLYEEFRKQDRETKGDEALRQRISDRLVDQVLQLLTPEQRETVQARLNPRGSPLGRRAGEPGPGDAPPGTDGRERKGP